MSCQNTPSEAPLFAGRAVGFAPVLTLTRDMGTIDASPWEDRVRTTPLRCVLVALLLLGGCGDRQVDNGWEMVWVSGIPRLWHDGKTVWVAQYCGKALSRVDPRAPSLEVVPVDLGGMPDTRGDGYIVGCPDGTGHLYGSPSAHYDGARWRGHGSWSFTTVTCGTHGAWGLWGRDQSKLFRFDAGRWQPRAGNPIGRHLESMATGCHAGRCRSWVVGAEKALTIDAAGQIGVDTELESWAPGWVRSVRDGDGTRVFAQVSSGGGAVLELDQSGAVPRWRPTTLPLPIAAHRGRVWAWDRDRRRLFEVDATGEKRDWGLAFRPSSRYASRGIVSAVVRDGWLWVTGFDMAPHDGIYNSMMCAGPTTYGFIARRPVDP
jgi:hypothetical protein